MSNNLWIIEKPSGVFIGEFANWRPVQAFDSIIRRSGLATGEPPVAVLIGWSKSYEQ